MGEFSLRDSSPTSSSLILLRRLSQSKSDEVRSHQCPLLWTWVLEKMGMLEIVERLTNKQHGDTKVYPGSVPRRENPTPACLLLIMAEPKVTGVHRCNLVWRCVCESMSREI